MSASPSSSVGTMIELDQLSCFATAAQLQQARVGAMPTPDLESTNNFCLHIMDGVR